MPSTKNPSRLFVPVLDITKAIPQAKELIDALRKNKTEEPTEIVFCLACKSFSDGSSSCSRHEKTPVGDELITKINEFLTKAKKMAAEEGAAVQLLLTPSLGQLVEAQKQSQALGVAPPSGIESELIIPQPEGEANDDMSCCYSPSDIESALITHQPEGEADDDMSHHQPSLDEEALRLVLDPNASHLPFLLLGEREEANRLYSTNQGITAIAITGSKTIIIFLYTADGLPKPPQLFEHLGHRLARITPIGKDMAKVSKTFSDFLGSASNQFRKMRDIPALANDTDIADGQKVAKGLLALLEAGVSNPHRYSTSCLQEAQRSFEEFYNSNSSDIITVLGTNLSEIFRTIRNQSLVIKAIQNHDIPEADEKKIHEYIALLLHWSADIIPSDSELYTFICKNPYDTNQSREDSQAWHAHLQLFLDQAWENIQQTVNRIVAEIKAEPEPEPEPELGPEPGLEPKPEQAQSDTISKGSKLADDVLRSYQDEIIQTNNATQATTPNAQLLETTKKILDGMRGNLKETKELIKLLEELNSKYGATLNDKSAEPEPEAQAEAHSGLRPGKDKRHEKDATSFSTLRFNAATGGGIISVDLPVKDKAGPNPPAGGFARVKKVTNLDNPEEGLNPEESLVVKTHTYLKIGDLSFKIHPVLLRKEYKSKFTAIRDLLKKGEKDEDELAIEGLTNMLANIACDWNPLRPHDGPEAEAQPEADVAEAQAEAAKKRRIMADAFEAAKSRIMAHAHAKKESIVQEIKQEEQVLQDMGQLRGYLEQTTKISGTASVIKYYTLMKDGGISLDDHINAQESSKDTRDIALLFLRICDAIGKMHKKGIFHGDIKPLNMLIKNGEITPCDFGNAVKKGDRERTWINLNGGTRNFVPKKEVQGLYLPIHQAVYDYGSYGASEDNVTRLKTKINEIVHNYLNSAETEKGAVPAGHQAVETASLEKIEVITAQNRKGVEAAVLCLIAKLTEAKDLYALGVTLTHVFKEAGAVALRQAPSSDYRAAKHQWQNAKEDLLTPILDNLMNKDYRERDLKQAIRVCARCLTLESCISVIEQLSNFSDEAQEIILPVMQQKFNDLTIALEADASSLALEEGKAETVEKLLASVKKLSPENRNKIFPSREANSLVGALDQAIIELQGNKRLQQEEEGKEAIEHFRNARVIAEQLAGAIALEQAGTLEAYNTFKKKHPDSAQWEDLLTSLTRKNTPLLEEEEKEEPRKTSSSHKSTNDDIPSKQAVEVYKAACDLALKMDALRKIAPTLKRAIEWIPDSPDEDKKFSSRIVVNNNEEKSVRSPLDSAKIHQEIEKPGGKKDVKDSIIEDMGRRARASKKGTELQLTFEEKILPKLTISSHTIDLVIPFLALMLSHQPLNESKWRNLSNLMESLEKAKTEPKKKAPQISCIQP